LWGRSGGRIELPELNGYGLFIERCVKSPGCEPIVNGEDKDSMGFGLVADNVLRALGTGPAQHGLRGRVEVGNRCWTGDSAGVDDGVLRDECDLPNSIEGHRCVARNMVTDEDRKVFGGIAVDPLVADERPDCYKADRGSSDERGEIGRAHV